MGTATMTSPSTISKPITPWRSTLWWRTIRVILGIVAWALLMLFLLLTAYVVGAVLLGLMLLGSGPSADSDTPVLVIALVSLLITGALALLIARFFTPMRTVLLVVGTAVLVLLIAGATWASVAPDRALFVARDIAWGPSDVRDYQKFSQRVISNAGNTDTTTPAFQFKQNPQPELFQSMTIDYTQEGQAKQANFEELLKSTQTTSFIVIKDGAVLYEGYFNGYNRDSIVTSFSTAKSVTSALIGIAIDEGRIKSVDDPIIDYLPELKGKGLDTVTIRHLLLMSSGIKYVTDDEVSGPAELWLFSDDALTYSYPDLKSQALAQPADGKAPGTEFNYNNYVPQLLGTILERTTHMAPAQYLQEKIWKPLGMEYPASWSLDSTKSDFEQMQSGINARAIDFAKFGQLFLQNGSWQGKQIISEQWVKESTSPYPTNPNGNIAWRANTWFTNWREASANGTGYYKYQWWGRVRPDGSYDFMAQGHLGQWIYVSPQNNTVVVRYGISDKGVDSWEDVLATVVNKTKSVAPGPTGSPGSTTTQASWPPPGWSSGTLEEQGFDSAKMAEGLLAMRDASIPIHSLMLVRNGSVALDASFYPYDGRGVHDLASVTKSIMSTLIGIASDQGKLKLDDTLVSFFPDRTIANLDSRKQHITVRHLASMSSGLNCTRANHESLTLQMRASPDWVQYALDTPVRWEPGTHFEYCNLNMHLLSGVLTKATGMTALEFARQNLFEPLGIQEVVWPTDPQGNNWGWGNLYLIPHDLAKIGYLWTNEGKWGDKQVVSREWVESAVKGQIASDSGEDYGYGWWVGVGQQAGEYYADGVGGQSLRVIPSANAIIVTTGGGFEIDQIMPYITAAFVDKQGVLPANPAGVARLNQALVMLAQSPDKPGPVPTPPATARLVSGKTYVFGEGQNSVIKSLRLDFNDSAQAQFQISVVDYQSTRGGPVGLDGIYRISSLPGPNYLPEAFRGRWSDAQTFLIDYDRVSGRERFTLTLRFEGEAADQVIIEAQGRSGEGNFRAEGKVQSP